MKKLTILLLLFAGSIYAQDFDFNCNTFLTNYDGINYIGEQGNLPAFVEVSSEGVEITINYGDGIGCLSSELRSIVFVDDNTITGTHDGAATRITASLTAMTITSGFGADVFAATSTTRDEFCE